MRRVKYWGSVLNWAVGILMSVATPATADIIHGVNLQLSPLASVSGYFETDRAIGLFEPQGQFFGCASKGSMTEFRRE